MPDEADSPLVSGHPPDAPAPRPPLQRLGSCRTASRVAPAQRDRLVTEPVDVTDLAAMTAFVERTIGARGRVDVLVGAVGGFAGGSLLETDAATWRRMLELNLTSAFAATKAVAPHMVRARYGRVVLVASRAGVPPAGRLIPPPGVQGGANPLRHAL